MAIRSPKIVKGKQTKMIRRRLLSSSLPSSGVPNGHLAVYVGEEKKTRYVVSISYLSHLSFQGLLCQVEEEFGFNRPMGGLTLPCREQVFLDLTCTL